MEKKRRRRRYTLREQLLSLAIGIMIGLLAGLAHANSVQQHRQAIVSLPSEPPAIMATQEAPETPTAPPEPYNDPNIPDNVDLYCIEPLARLMTYLLSFWKPLHFMRAVTAWMRSTVTASA